ncbi:MAG: hypothetical protein Q9163_001459 [Psora crenata]
MANTVSPNVELSALDQIMPRVYTRLILSFPVLKEQLDPATSLLQRALERTVAEIPFLKFQVASSPSGGTGRLELRPSADAHSTLFVVKVLTDAGSGWNRSYEDLRQANMPISELDGEVLAPVGLIRMSGEREPVMATQLNVLDGGCLLCVCFHHNVMDGVGVGTVIRLWASHCRALQQDSQEPLESFKLQAGSLDRSPLIQGGRDDQYWTHQAYDFAQPPPPVNGPKDETSPPSMPPMPPMTAAIFELDMSVITSLKHDLIEHLAPHSQEAGWVSTNDTLCAVLWHGIVAARSSGTSTDFEEESNLEFSRLGMAVNSRGKLEPPLPRTYLGNVNIYSMTVVDFPKLKSSAIACLAETASVIRKSITSIDDAYIRSLIHTVDGLQNVKLVSPAFNRLVDKDLAITSWAELGLYDLDWGNTIGGGKVEFVRIPKAAFAGLCIVLPRMSDGALEVITGLTEEAMDRLKKDPVFMRYATFKCE